LTRRNVEKRFGAEDFVLANIGFFKDCRWSGNRENVHCGGNALAF
jgi:hypothetical protein